MKQIILLLMLASSALLPIVGAGENLGRCLVYPVRNYVLAGNTLPVIVMMSNVRNETWALNSITVEVTGSKTGKIRGSKIEGFGVRSMPPNKRSEFYFEIPLTKGKSEDAKISTELRALVNEEYVRSECNDEEIRIFNKGDTLDQAKSLAERLWDFLFN